jgi:hypothetical protein
MENEVDTELEQRIENKILELFGKEYHKLDLQYQEIITNQMTIEEGVKEIEDQYQELLNERKPEEIIACIHVAPLSNNITIEQQKRMAQYEREKKAKLTRYSVESQINLHESIYLIEKQNSPTETPKPTSFIAEYHRRREVKMNINPNISNRQIKKKLYLEKLSASRNKK